MTVNDKSGCVVPCLMHAESLDDIFIRSKEF